VLVVEHDKETIEMADYVIDLGPRAGRHGGEIVAAGTPKKIAASKKSLTGLYLSGKKSIPVPAQRREGNGNFLEIIGARGNNLKNVNYYFAKCCNPILGDHVFGFVTTQGKISIHRYDCPNAKRLLDKYPYRVLPIKWLNTNEEIYKNAVIRIQGKDELGLVGEITSLISKDLNINMRSINFESKGKLFDGRVTVMIKSVDHLNGLIYRLGKIKGVQKVNRVK